MFGPTRELIGRVDSTAYGAITRYGAAFQTASATNDLCNSPVLHRTSPTTPAGFNSSRFRLMPVRSPLLRQSRLISLPPDTEMFQFPGLANPTYGFSRDQFGDLRIKARLAAPLSFSQSSTPFIAFWCQDIHHAPLVA